MDTHIFPNARITVEQVAKRLGIGRPAVYAMLDQGILPGVRLGRRWLITRYAYEAWERTCGAEIGQKTALDSGCLKS
jgi:excisionase family DNA binding protein